MHLCKMGAFTDIISVSPPVILIPFITPKPSLYFSFSTEF